MNWETKVKQTRKILKTNHIFLFKSNLNQLPFVYLRIKVIHLGSSGLQVRFTLLNTLGIYIVGSSEVPVS